MLTALQLKIQVIFEESAEDHIFQDIYVLSNTITKAREGVSLEIMMITAGKKRLNYNCKIHYPFILTSPFMQRNPKVSPLQTFSEGKLALVHFFCKQDMCKLLV